MLYEYEQKRLANEVESFKDQLEFVKSLLKDDEGVKLFMICKAIKSISLDLPDVQHVSTVDDSLSLIPDRLEELIRVIRDRE